MDFQGLQAQIEANRRRAGLVDQEDAEELEDSVESSDSATATNLTSFVENWRENSRYSTASGENLPYVVIQVTLKEKLLGTGSKNLTDLEEIINQQTAKGYRLHTMSTTSTDSKGFVGGDRIQATLVFERIDVYRGTYTPEEQH